MADKVETKPAAAAPVAAAPAPAPVVAPAPVEPPTPKPVVVAVEPLWSLSEIHYGTATSPAVAAPGDVFVPKAADRKSLVNGEWPAARELTEQELAFHNLTAKTAEEDTSALG